MGVRVGGCAWCGGGRRRVALGLALLLVPTLFWTAVFASLAGAFEIADFGLRIADCGVAGVEWSAPR